MRSKSLTTGALVSLFALTVAALPASASPKGSDKSRTYQVTITNLTAGQPITPPILVTHTDAARIFTVGEPSSYEVQQIAENGNGAPLMAALGADPEVFEVVAGAAPLVPANNPGGAPFDSSASFMITASGKADRLSVISMLICTNDGFTGLDSVELPKKSMTILAGSYDARSEMNTEDFANMVPPCQGLIGVSSGDPGTGMSDPLLAEDGVVIPHPGINGGVDLHREVHGWNDPAVKIVIERM